MKYLLLPILFASFSIVTAQTPCVGGMAGVYPCNGYYLQARITLSDMNASDGNDSWGWTDPQDGKEYALMGLDNGTGFIDISDPTNPIYLGKLPTHTTSSSWRDIKVYNDYAFVVSEANNHGMQVFDLTRLRNVVNPPVTFTEDAHYGGFGSAHNLVINEETGYAFGVGTQTFNGGPHFVNIQNPLNPVGVGGFALDDYSHDGQVIIYNGPDSDYTGREIFIGSNESLVSIVDITDKANPQSISTISYPNVSYTHQGWLTENQRYFLLGDEIDEIQFGFNTRTVVFDLNDLDNPEIHFEYLGPTSATDHNGYVKGDKFYLANYRAGLREINIADIANGNINEIAFFDTYPSNNNASTTGAWSVYPYFGSGNIVISDISRGFFLVKSSAIDTIAPNAVCQNITVALDENGEATVEATLVDGGSSDNSGFYTLSMNQNTFDCTDLGANSVVLTVTDPSGNTDTCTAVITIVDDLAPEIDCPVDNTVVYDAGGSFYTLPDYEAEGTVTAVDNCTANLTIIQDPIAGTQLTEGVYTITFEAVDDEGNTGICSFELTVNEFLSVDSTELNSSLSIYPNPASQIITVASKNQLLENIEIYDVLGKRIFSLEKADPASNVIDISSYSKGMYFLKINNKLTKKIIKN